jgi:hypothetical protein
VAVAALFAGPSCFLSAELLVGRASGRLVPSGRDVGFFEDAFDREWTVGV